MKLAGLIKQKTEDTLRGILELIGKMMKQKKQFSTVDSLTEISQEALSKKLCVALV